MSFREKIAENAEGIGKDWLDRILSSFPAETARFFENRRDRIANPIGYALAETVEAVIGCMASGGAREDLYRAVFPFVQIMSLQDKLPSEAFSFVFSLRTCLLKVPGIAQEREEVQAELDALAMATLDAFGECMSRLHKVKEAELKQNLHMLLRKSAMVAEVSPE